MDINLAVVCEVLKRVVIVSIVIHKVVYVIAPDVHLHYLMKTLGVLITHIEPFDT